MTSVTNNDNNALPALVVEDNTATTTTNKQLSGTNDSIKSTSLSSSSSSADAPVARPVPPQAPGDDVYEYTGGGLDQSTTSTGTISASAAIQAIKGKIFPASGTFSGVSVAEEMNPLRRSTMEDVHRVLPVFDGDENVSFVGIYDGHGGREIVDFLATELEKNIAQELQVNDGASIPDKLSRAYILTDVQSRQAELMGSGATAVTCLIKRKPRKDHEGGGVGQGEEGEEDIREIYAANVGDSRAVLCYQGKGMRLTYDHKADDNAEQARIEAAGGFVLRNRVLGILAVTRSFGDHRMKDYVIGAPYTSTTLVKSTAESPFLILACDGVWDVISDDEAVSMVMELKEKEEGRTDVDAAAFLVQEAMRRGSSDNITCIVVFF